MKILIGVDKGSYTFNAAAKTVTLSGIPKITITQLLLITNITTNEIIYSPVISGKGGTTTNNIITLVYDTTSMNNNDILQIFVHLDEVAEVKYSTGEPILDSFGRIAISSPNTIFQSNFAIQRDTYVWETIVATGGTTSFATSSSALDLIVGPTSGSYVLSEQHGYNYYTPGKSQTIFISSVFGASQSGVTRRVGYYNDTDGIYYEHRNGIMYSKLRSSVTGNIVETSITQSSWNLDTLDGSFSTSNPSGILLDPTKVQIQFFDFQWLGAGRIRYGFDIDGRVIPVHEILNANIISNTYMSSGSLPIRHEILLTASIAGTASLKQICSTVISGGGDVPLSKQRVASLGLTSRTISSGVRSSLLSIRLSSLVGGRINRNIVYPLSIDLLTTSNAQIYVELILQRAHLSETNLGGSPTWTSITGSSVEYSVNGTKVAGGTIIANGYISSIGRETILELKSKDDFLALNATGSLSDYLHLVVTPTANAAIYGSIKFIETR